uniref:RNA-directed DNA polymerase, eukaryota, reverse transcriptase zinc-binding domain protein n=1 Tax=Tanacetum cinerariifolium TaxID=118510 RepID=A0A699HKB4_TANCI|nr:RNA-directed DNA polymerase, eukaryota, reverse transcriptase zinc-binding domain protein [Tanacetum cinerariifolium]
MNIFVEAINGNQKFLCSFVYAYYKEFCRKALWNDLIKHSLVVKDAPWALLGEFNVILKPSERSFGSSSISTGMEDFRSYISNIKFSVLVMSGLKFTWNKIPKSLNGLLKKLDRVMCNMSLLDKFPSLNANFLPFVNSDNTPYVLNIPSVSGPKPKLFKFANFLSSKVEFLSTVRSVWDEKILGYAMFSLASKLKLLKKHFRKLKYSQGDLAENAKALKKKKRALLSIEDDKAPGPDGFSFKFFMFAWSIVGAEFSQAIFDFFSNVKILKEVNATVIALVPNS